MESAHPKILKTNITPKDSKLLNPIIMREYLQESLTLRQRSNLTNLYAKYGELNVQRVMFHGVRALRKKDYDPCPREENDSFYEDSEETLDIYPPPGERPVMKFLNRRTETTENETPEPFHIQHQANTIELGERVSPLPSPKRTRGKEMSEEKADKKYHLNFKQWDEGIAVLGSDVEDEYVDDTEKPHIEEKPYWPTLNELVSRAKACEQAKEESTLSKRPPQVVPTIEAQEESANSKKLRRPPQKRGFIPRRQSFKLWIEEHKKKIAEGKVPTKATFIWEALEESRIGELDEMREYTRKCGNDWEALYGENFDPVFAERGLRAPGVRREGWQRMKDKREPLRTKQALGLELERFEALDEFKKANAEAQAETRRHETLDEEAKRLKDMRKRRNESYRQQVEDQGGEVRAKRTPSEQRKARLKAKKDAEKARRDQKKAGSVVRQEKSEEDGEPC